MNPSPSKVPLPSRRCPTDVRGQDELRNRIAGVWQRYDLGPGHPLAGKSAPDLEFTDGTRLGVYLRSGRAFSFQLRGTSKPSVVEEQQRIRIVRATCVKSPPTSALFVRPDGFIAWARNENGDDDLARVVRKWLGAAAELQLVSANCEPTA